MNLFTPFSSPASGRRSCIRASIHAAFVLLLLLASGACDRLGGEQRVEAPPGTEVGQRPPVLEGRLPSGEAFSLTPTRGLRTVVIFYRSETCGLCRLRLEQLHQNLPAYEALRAEVVAVTLDPPELSTRTSTRLDGELRIISVDSSVFSSWNMLDAEQGPPLPGAYVLDEWGVVIFRHLGEHAGDRISDATLLTILETTPG